MLWPHPRSTRAAGRYYPVRAVFEELAVSRQREGNVVMSRPFRHLTHVAAGDHQDGHKALPQAAERDLRECSAGVD